MREIKRNAQTVTTSTVLLIYGLLMIFQPNVYLRVLEPPMRYILIFGCIFSSSITLFSALTGMNNLKGTALSWVAGIWGALAYLYFTHPLQNVSWLMCVGLTVVSLIALRRGDFLDDTN
ncbi:MAG: hypothetical protein F6I01_002105 [Aerococcus sanguinicola]